MVSFNEEMGHVKRDGSNQRLFTCDGLAWLTGLIFSITLQQLQDSSKVNLKDICSLTIQIRVLLEDCQTQINPFNQVSPSRVNVPLVGRRMGGVERTTLTVHPH